MGHPPLSPTMSFSSVSSLPTENIEHIASESLSLSNAASDSLTLAASCEFEDDPKFYFRQSNVKLIAEKRVYNVPRAPLERHSTFFRDLFAMPPDARLPPGWIQQELDVSGQTITVYLHGANDTVQLVRPNVNGPHHDAYLLHDVTAHEFGLFLTVLYPDDYTTHDLTTYEEWMPVLALSTRWHFAAIRKLALARLDSLLRNAPIERLSISRAHGILLWRVDALRALVYRPEPLSSEEIVRLHCDDIASIMKQRERVASVRNVDLAHGGWVRDRLNDIGSLKKAVDTISKAYCRVMWARRAHGRGVLPGLPQVRVDQIAACLRQDESMDWPRRSFYRLIFRGPLPHALTCLERLLYSAQANRNMIKIKARVALHEELEKYSSQQIKLAALVKELLALRQTLEPTSRLHRVQSLNQLRPHVARLCELVSEDAQLSKTLQFDRDIAYRGIVL
ncbi:hypothetical protein PENSPDRAFT_81304 [Peniophora sp. CONT]|nr:hypothetical protein PENSPDRAFT_81304 [Peniophora sp. CONT]